MINGVGRASESTRVAVLASIAELGYVPNRSARSLRGKSIQTIGLYVPETPSRSDYYMSFVFGVLEKASQRDVDVTIITSRGNLDGRRIPSIDGVIVSDPMAGDHLSRALLGSAIPTVTCERTVTGPIPDGMIWADHARAMATMLARMKDAGSARPGLIIPSETGDWAISVARGYREWCTENDVPALIEYIDWVPGAEQVSAALDRLFSTDPVLDAVICGPVETAQMAMPNLQARGKMIGDDFLLACATESRSLPLSQPPITAIDQFPREAGEQCAELLFDLINREVSSGATIELPLAIVDRRSTRGPRGR